MQDEELKGSFLSAMRRLAATVCVITCSDGDERYGMAATAVTSLSLDPVSLLVCINRSSDFHQRLTRAGKFCVNVLADTHTDQSRVFGSGRHWDERFKSGIWAGSGNEPPILVDAQASIVCTTDTSFDYGSHTIVVGRVRQVRVGEEIAPLVYLDREVISIRATSRSRTQSNA